MRKLTSASHGAFTNAKNTYLLVWFFSLLFVMNGKSQCTPQSNTINGVVFEDANDDGRFQNNEIGIGGIIITAYDSDGIAIDMDMSANDGSYQLDGLVDGTSYRVLFSNEGKYASSHSGDDNGTSVQIISAPACNASYGLTDNSALCGSDPELYLTCFVQGEVSTNGDVESIISVNHNFTALSPVSKLASHGETGSIWGLAHNPYNDHIYSAAFVKQYAGLKYGPYAILKTDVASKTTSKFVSVDELTNVNLPGIPTGVLPDDCTYGNNVGRVGLGGLLLSEDSKYLYVTVLDNNTVMKIPIDNPTSTNTEVFTIAAPSQMDSGEEFRIFAINQKDGLLYIGGTVTGSVSKDKNKSAMAIITLDPNTGNTDYIFYSTYLKGTWQDALPSSLGISHWFTDIDFTDSGEILVSLSDRIGHRYCKSPNNRLDQQFPDLLILSKNPTTQAWELEKNGTISGRTGSGVGNGEGPQGGEFFGFDFWPTNPSYHSETALGSVFVLPGTNSVIAAVYDPMLNSYSGGLHKYSTIDGSKQSAIELYSHATDPLFGKATGFGDIIARCAAPSIEIGNYVWYDTNSNGIQDAGESGIPNINIYLYDENCEIVGVTETDENGHYVFNQTNVDNNGDNVMDGVYANANYFISLDINIYNDVTGLYVLNGNEYTVCVSSLDTDDDAYDCDAVLQDGSCTDQPIVSIQTGVTNHTFDIGLGTPSGFDLALIKEIVGDKFAKVGDDIMFMITIYNQGGVTASKVDIVDYMPSGYEFVQADNSAWSLEDGVLKTSITQNLLPGHSVTRMLRLKVKGGANLDYKNIAEIEQGYNLAGLPESDIDSEGDAEADNDNGGELGTTSDNQLNGDGTNDEDDQDPAAPYIFDLAVKVTLENDKLYCADDLVKFDITLYNQGDTDADYVKLINYASADLKFNEGLSTGWVDNGDGIYLEENEVLAAGEIKDYCIYFNVEKDLTIDEIINFVEIAESSPVGDGRSLDFDSNPDESLDNDNGGEVNGSTDNVVTDSGIVDEDDHDPVSLKSRYVDLALMVFTPSKRAKAGATIEFFIEVFNQGTLPVKSFEVVDYIPEYMTLVDGNWILDGTKAYRMITLEDPLYQGEKYKTSIKLKINEEASPRTFVNYAEINNVLDVNNVQIGSKDIDSSPDNIIENDKGGQPGSDYDDYILGTKDIDEDDHDPAFVSTYNAFLEGSECLSNATTSSNGQFEDHFVIIGPSGDGWYVLAANNYYEESSVDPPASPTLLATGPSALLEEVVQGGGLSTYTIYVKRIDGDPASISFRNIDGDVETLTVPASNYADILIDGAQAVCNGGLEVYSVLNADPLANYTWELPDGGSFTLLTESSIEVDWSTVAPNAVYSVNVSADNNCYAPGTVDVSIGTAGGSMSCIGSINLSLDADCEVQVKPTLLLTGTIPTGAAYSVMLTTNTGEVIPNATLTPAHLGMTVTAKVIDACSGNSCWSSILVEDKIKPTIVCQDVTVACNKIDEFPGPFAQDNCGGQVVVTMLNETINILTCDDDYVAEIERQYQATDAYGNKSAICGMSVLVERVKLDSIKFPMDFKMMDGTALTCGGYDLNPDGTPAVTVTGVPTYNGEDVFPDFELLCNSALTYEDKVLKVNGIIKIMRKWTAWEWHCGATNKEDHTQVIEILDTEAPEITCPNDITASAVGGNCEATLTLPLPTVIDACSDEIAVTILTPYKLIKDGESRVVTLGFENSPYTITYTATDPAGNAAVCEIMVTVIDDIAPVAICDQGNVVSLTSNGIGYMYASMVDGGSTDACGIDYIEVRRVDQNGNSNDPFSDKVVFGCDDVGPNNMVELRVVDLGGLSNSCMVGVEVQDKQAPQVVSPPNLTIQCGDEYLPVSQFGNFTYNDACVVSVDSMDVINIGVCGSGTITRTYTVSDGPNTSTGVQVITIENNSPFDIDNVISWPADLDTTGDCDVNNLIPDNLPTVNAYPIWENLGICAMIAPSYSDQVYYIQSDVEQACFKIVRTWTLLDMCQMNQSGYTPLTHIQIIKVSNTDAPEISTNPILPISTPDCDGADVSLFATAVDCSSPADLDWMINVDFDQDFISTGVYDYTDMGSGDRADFMGMLPLGIHNIVWTFTDPCNNSSTVTQEIVISNNAAPVIICKSKVTVGLGPMDLDNDGNIDTEMACITAASLIASASHPCNVPFEYSFSPDAIVPDTCFDCNDIGLNFVTVYAIDQFGNVGSCMDTVVVEDNNDTDICVNINDCFACGPDVDLNANGTCQGVVNVDDFDAIMINNDCGPLTITHDYNAAPSNTTLIGASFPLGSTTVTWTITDGVMIETCTQTITVTDETDPMISCASNQTVNTSSIIGCVYMVSNNALDASASDNCGVVELYHDYASAPSITTLQGASFGLGTTVVTWTAEDAAGNTATCPVSITVVDNTDPIIMCAGPITFNDSADGEDGCSHVMGSTSLDPMVSDECSTVGIPTHNFGNAPSNTTLQGAEFPLGLTVITWTVSDDKGNVATCNVAVTVNDDIDPEVVTCSSDISFSTSMIPNNECGFSINNASLDPTGDDNCDIVTLEHDYGNAPFNNTLNGATFDLGTTVITWTVTDQAGNTATCQYSITVIDDTPPPCTTQTPVSVDIGMSGMFVFDESILNNPIIDNCDDDLTYTFIPPFVDCDDVGDVIDVTIQVSDDAGNVSNCSIQVTVNETSEIECNPIDITVNLNANGSVTITEDQVVDPGTTMCGADIDVEINPSSFDCSNVGVNPVTITVMGGGDTETCTAMVTVVDNLNPTITCGPDRVFGDSADNSDNAPDCTHTVSSTILDPINIDDNCPGETAVHNYTSAPSNTTLNGANFPLGETVIIWTVTDASGNTNTCDIEVTVIDDIAPTCEMQDTIFGTIDASGIFVITEDLLSSQITDNCDPDVVVTFNPTQLTCDDVDEPVIVTITATDDALNVTTCEVVVVITENIALECNPMDITINLDEFGEISITPDQVVTVSGSTCGVPPMISLSQSQFFCNDQGLKVVEITVTSGTETSMCTAMVTIVDTIYGPQVQCVNVDDIPCSEFENNYAGSIDNVLNAFDIILVIDDNCPVTPSAYNDEYTIDTLVTMDLNDCNYGSITRMVTVTDDNGMTSTCTQVINILEPSDPITQADIDGIIPSIVNIEECTSPSNLNIDQITIGDLIGLSDCGSFMISFVDTQIGTDCPIVIERVYTIVATCQDETFTFTQTININDTTAPVIVPIDDVDLYVATDPCLVVANFSASISATDNCSAATLSMAIDGGDNIDIDSTLFLDFGIHNVIVTATDACGNIAMDTFDVNVQDTTSLSVECIKVITFIDTITLMATATVLDFVKVFGNCDNMDTLVFSFSPDNFADTILTGGCDDIEAKLLNLFAWQVVNGDTIPFDLVPLATVDTNFCKIEWEIQDPFNACGNTIFGISGEIYTYDGEGIPNYEVTLMGSGIHRLSDDEGVYAFPLMPQDGQYEIMPYNDGDMMNGVSTLDLIYIQRHILGIEYLDNPYFILAADINNSEDVTSSDLIALRKMILGITDHFPNNTSWRSIDASHVFADATNPWLSPLKESYKIYSLQSDMDVNFVGVKTGDVNGSAVVNLKSSIEASTRSNAVQTLFIEGSNEEAITLVADEDVTLSGMQFTIDLNGLKLKSIESSEFEGHEIAFYEISSGVYNVVLATSQARLIEANETIVVFNIDCTDCASNIDNIKLTEGLTPEMYTGLAIEVTTIDIVQRTSVVEQTAFNVRQNTPNPWTEVTSIIVSMPNRGNATLAIFDTNGKLIYADSRVLEAGDNIIEIDNSIVPGSGLYFYQVESAGQSIRHKMIKLN